MIETVKPQPRFFDRKAKIAFGSTVGLLSVDSISTCKNLAKGNHEDFLHTQKCGIAVAEMAGEASLLWAGAYLAHKHNHHKIERLLEWTMPLVNGEAIIYSKKNTR